MGRSYAVRRGVAPQCAVTFVVAVLLCAVATIARADPVRLRVWDYPRWPSAPDRVDRYHWIEARLQEFEQQHPDITVDFTRLTWNYGADKVRVATLAGVGPDLVAGAPMVEFIARDLVEPVDAYLDADDKADYLPAALHAFTWRDHVWGWPWYQTGSVMIGNRDLFEAAGVEPPPDGRWSRADFEEALLRLSRPDAEPPRYGFGYAVGDSLAVWPFLFPGRGGASTEIVPRDDALALGLARLRGYRASGWTPPGSGGLTSDPVWESFATHRRTAMIPVGVWAIPALRNRAPFPFIVMHYPDGVRPFVAVSGWMVLRHDDVRKRDAAMALARFLTDGENQRALKAYGVFPTRRSTGDIYADDPEMSAAASVLARGRPIPLHPRWPQIERGITVTVQEALTTPSFTAEQLADALARLRDEAARPMPVTESSEAVTATRSSGALIGLLAGCALALLVVLFAGRGRAWRYALCVLPAGLLLGGLLVWPLVWSFLLSFSEFNVARGWISEWVGAEHYRTILTLPAFRAALRNTVVYTAVVVPAQVVIALVLASLIAPLGARSRSWFRGAFYLPGVTSVVVLSLIWQWMFNEEAGALNGLLGFWGFGTVRWLSDPHIALGSIILMTIARPPGGPMLIYLAAIDAVPRHVMDAAAIDGASSWRRWWTVTVPLVRPTTTFLIVTALIGSFQVFAPVYVMTDGGPGHATTVLVHQIYTTAMRDFDFGRASAMAVVLTVLLIGATLWQARRRSEALEY